MVSHVERFALSRGLTATFDSLEALKPGSGVVKLLRKKGHRENEQTADQREIVKHAVAAADDTPIQ